MFLTSFSKLQNPCSDLFFWKEVCYRFPLPFFDLLKVMPYLKVMNTPSIVINFLKLNVRIDGRTSQMELFAKIVNGFKLHLKLHLRLDVYRHMSLGWYFN